MQDSAKPRTPEMINRVVSAEIPDKNVNPKLYDIITTNNIHGPCGRAINPNRPCMAGEGSQKHCSKRFPKPFSNTTVVRDDAYPEYRRRSPDQGGQTHKIKLYGKDFDIDNSWIVPYNPTLSLRYKCHINVEIVHTVAAVKYLYKYITKGNDRIIINFDNDGQPREDVVHDEIQNFLNVRFMSTSEGYVKIYNIPIHYKNISVVKLPCHLENEQMVTIPEGAQPDQILPPVTKLTAYFEKNKHDDLAKNTTYINMPTFFVWVKGTKDVSGHWKRRERGKANECFEFTSDAIGRINRIANNARQSELYHLRILLHHRKGPTCYNDLKKVNIEAQEVICDTFREACQKLGLLHDDTEIDKAMKDASSMAFGDSLRYFFCSLLIFCSPVTPFKFWNDWKIELCRDKMVKEGLIEPNRIMVEEVLLYIKERLEKEHFTMEQFNLPEPEIRVIEAAEEVRMLDEETNYNIESLKELVLQKYQILNEGQKLVFKEVMNSVNNNSGKIFCLNAGGGTGKTTTNNLLLAKVRSQSKVALATAVSGIAATLLDNGRTLHSRCKVPIKLKGNSTCIMTKRDPTGKLFQKAALLIIDEVTMGHKHIFECIDRSLRYIRGCENKPFGGLTVLFSGDWHQILPVVKRGSRAETVDATLKQSYIWKKYVHPLSLEQNMRLANSESDESDFHQFLSNIGNGRGNLLPLHGQFATEIPPEMTVVSSDDLFNFVFGELLENYKNSEWLCSRALIAPTNNDVDMINEIMINQFPGECKIFKSADKVESNEHLYPLEYINKETPPGFPQHELKLKQHAPIMLLRNFDPSNGHCNGTKYVIKQMTDHVLDAVIATGEHAGKRLFIPRIPLSTDPDSYAFSMTRKQFPVRLAFGITANKAQGQTLKKVGIYLRSNFFSHGQFYVACSRVESSKNLKIWIPNTNDIAYTDNVVYPEILK